MRPSESNGKRFVFKNYRSNVTILGHSQLRDFRGKYRNQRANISMCPGASIREALIKQFFLIAIHIHKLKPLKNDIIAVYKALIK